VVGNCSTIKSRRGVWIYSEFNGLNIIIKTALCFKAQPATFLTINLMDVPVFSVNNYLEFGTNLK